MNNKKNKLKDLLNYYLKKKFTVVDAGVNKGHFLTKKIGLKNISKAVMIDPIKDKALNKLINKKFKYFDIALGNKKKKTSFYIHSNNHSEWSSLHKISKKSPYNTLYKKHLIKPIKKIVYQDSLDNILNKNTIIKNYLGSDSKKIDILKIDCQSNTLPILLGGNKTFKTNKIKMIIAAINPYDFYENKKDDFTKILKYLDTKNYRLINIANAHNGKLGNLNYSFSDFRIWTFDAIFMKKR